MKKFYLGQKKIFIKWPEKDSRQRKLFWKFLKSKFVIFYKYWKNNCRPKKCFFLRWPEKDSRQNNYFGPCIFFVKSSSWFMLGVLPLIQNGFIFQDSLQEVVSNLNLILSNLIQQKKLGWTTLFSASQYFSGTSRSTLFLLPLTTSSFMLD